MAINKKPPMNPLLMWTFIMVVSLTVLSLMICAGISLYNAPLQAELFKHCLWGWQTGFGVIMGLIAGQSKLLRS
jgi:Ni,Fe-hydrogenase I cytochrome b subunit